MVLSRAKNMVRCTISQAGSGCWAKMITRPIDMFPQNLYIGPYTKNARPEAKQMISCRKNSWPSF